MSFLQNLSWRHATKQFDPQKKVSDEHLKKILKAIQMTPTSLGLQPYKVYIIEDQALKDTLQTHSKNQPQIGTASHVLVFIKNLDTDELIHQYEHNALQKGVDPEKLSGFLKLVHSYKSKCNDSWAAEQVYLALGFALAACAELQIDSCAIGGFDPQEYDRVLALPKHLKSCIVLPIGYRKEDPQRPKVRFDQKDLFEWK